MWYLLYEYPWVEIILWTIVVLVIISIIIKLRGRKIPNRKITKYK